MASKRVGRIGCVLIFLAALNGSVTEATAQLRPYEPVEWELFDRANTFVGSAGIAAFEGQRASLAGETGRLGEIGGFSAFYRTGRVAIGAEGTVVRLFERESAFAPESGGALEDADGSRHDAGDYRISTIVRLTPEGLPALGVLRFGTRLPTTDNRVGLERDQIDFFATVGGRVDGGPVRVTTELGLGIHGTRETGYEQSDVLVYIASVGIPGLPVAPSVLLVGHADGLPDRHIRGNEELAEVRLRLRSSGRIWMQVEGIVGLMDFSPRRGASLRVGGIL